MWLGSPIFSYIAKKVALEKAHWKNVLYKQTTRSVSDLFLPVVKHTSEARQKSLQ